MGKISSTKFHSFYKPSSPSFKQIASPRRSRSALKANPSLASSTAWVIKYTCVKLLPTNWLFLENFFSFLGKTLRTTHYNFANTRCRLESNIEIKIALFHPKLTRQLSPNPSKTQVYYATSLMECLVLISCTPKHPSASPTISIIVTMYIK